MDISYTSLHSDEIRLLKPCKSPTHGIAFQLVHSSLATGPQYAALSYTWGEDVDHQEVLLDGKPLKVRKNLYAALLRLHELHLVQPQLWIDAICINQTDEREKSLQVRRMKDIYERAGSVLVWLGEPTDHANNQLAFALIKRLYKRWLRIVKKSRPYRPWWLPHKPRTNAQDIADFNLSLELTTDKSLVDVAGSDTFKAWEGVCDLWRSRWWSRTWVYQEATVPEPYKLYVVSGIMIRPHKAKVTMVFGNLSTSWAEMSILGITASKIARTPEVRHTLPPDIQHRYALFSVFRDRRIYSDRGLPFLGIAQMMRLTDCADPRDKIYAPLCLAPEPVRQFIKPDYQNKSVADVYLDVVRYYLSGSQQSLEFLGYAMYQQDARPIKTSQGTEYVLPSWIPNFADHLNIMAIPLFLQTYDTMPRKEVVLIDRRVLPHLKAVLTFAYSPLGQPRSRASIEGQNLFVSGVRLDSVLDMFELGNTEEKLEIIRRKTREWKAKMQGRYFTGEPYVDAYCRTIVLDISWDEAVRPMARGGKFSVADSKVPEEDLNQEKYRAKRALHTPLGWIAMQRLLGLSAKSYILMIPNSSVVGDEIWALEAGRALYILRPIDKEHHQYLYVGECYAHGLMDGAIETMLQTGELSMQRICIV